MNRVRISEICRQLSSSAAPGSYSVPLFLLLVNSRRVNHILSVVNTNERGSRRRVKGVKVRIQPEVGSFRDTTSPVVVEIVLQRGELAQLNSIQNHGL
jgi:hypothetical protein